VDANIITGVDIGGTKTQIRVIEGSVILADQIIATDEWRVRDAKSDAKTLAEIVRRACQGRAPQALAVGAHGCDTDDQCLAVQAHLSAEIASLVMVVNDSELMVPAAGFIEGIGVVAGTGSIAVARTPDGRMLTAGGWGWILGDEGSAPALVREAARAVRGELDRGRADDPLVRSLMQSVGAEDPTMLGRLLDATRGSVVWGRYAASVFSAAGMGSQLAQHVIREGGSGLANLVGILIGRGANAARVVAGGGVIAEQPLLMQAFKEAMKQVSPHSDVLLLRAPPVAGAVALAQRLLATSIHST
jgi:glucosamine kinase